MSRNAFLFALLAPALAAAAGVSPVAGSTYTISPASHPEVCLAPASNVDGAAVVTKDCNTADDIVWSLAGTTLVNSATNKCIDIKDGAAVSGNKLQVWDCYANNRNQVFGVSGESIKWGGRDFCFDLTDGSGEIGNGIQIWSCFDNNKNQMWEFIDAEEVESCDAVATNSLATTTAAATGIGGVLLAVTVSASSTSTSSSGGGKHRRPSTSVTDATSTASASTSTSSTLTSSTAASFTATSSSATSSSATSSTATSSIATSSTAAPAATAASGSTSGYLQTSGTRVVDASGNNVVLRGTNIGGWLVSEDWMNGISDYSGNADRFAQETLENRFGAASTRTLMNAWYDNFMTTSDWDNIASMGFNMVRLPFGWRNLQWANGSWITDGSGNIDFSRLDWAIAQAKQRNIYVIPVFHIWDTQQQKYSLISENSNEGQSSRDRAGEIWKKVAAHFLGETTIAAYDAINEPTGSWGDLLQQSLYSAIRSVDPKRIIVMESISTNPANYGWSNVIYSYHEYLSMGSDYQANVATWASGWQTAKAQWNSYGIPAYMGEWMSDGQTLTMHLSSLNSDGVWYSSWALKTVNMGRWGLYNLGSQVHVDVSNDTYDSILKMWSNLGSVTRQAVADQYSSAIKQRSLTDRDTVESPRAGQAMRRRGGHAGRSRRLAIVHGKRSSTF